jgi:hypothetical protein
MTAEAEPLTHHTPLHVHPLKILKRAIHHQTAPIDVWRPAIPKEWFQLPP